MLDKVHSPILGLLIGLALFSPPTRCDGKDSQQAKNAEQKPSPTEAAAKNVGQGSLRIVQDDGGIVECPLKHTDVKADVAGFIARVNVTQTFHNPTQEKIEAVYVFPLPHEAAVDEMTMVIGEREIVGIIKRRDDARRIHEQALAQGQTTALLEQERPNIFTQSVGNIPPGQEVKIRISYVDVLKYDVGEYEFHFPMVVGPRFIPGAPIDAPVPTPAGQQGKVSPPVANTDRVPDARRISPPVLKPEFRNGHEISLTLLLNAGVPVQNLAVPNHKATVDRKGDRQATIKLSPNDSIPNKDFVVRYGVVGQKPEMAVLAHTGKYSSDAAKLGKGYFMLMIQPQENQQLKKSPAREIVFLIDVSGSMRGAKTEKAKQAVQNMLALCRPKDTVQVITFASTANKLFEKPLPVDQTSIQRALDFTAGQRGGGGTRMLQGVKMAIDEPIDAQRLRVIVMLTDGFIGNEAEIIEHVGKRCGDQIRFWAVGIGQSPNMFLIEGVARQGGGMGKRLGLNDEAEQLSHDVMTRIQRAQLAKVKIDWGDMRVAETFPARIPELWAGRPIILFGRYQDGGRQEIKVSGSVEGEPVSWPLTVELPREQADHDVLAKVWARRQIEDLMQKSYYAGTPAVEETVTAIALDYRLMSPYTSFVAVDEKDADKITPSARPPRRMAVPVPLPEGAEWEGFFGGEFAADDVVLGARLQLDALERLKTKQSAWRYANAFGSGGGAGLGGGVALARSADGRNWSIPAPASDLAFNQPYLRQFGRPGAASPLSEYARRRSSAPVQALALSSGRGRGLGRALGGAIHTRSAYESDLRSKEEGFAFAAIQPHASALQKAAQTAIQDADAKGQSADLTRFHLLRACFLDRAAAIIRASDGSLAMVALGRLEEMHNKQITDWLEQLPALDKRLDLVLRDVSLAAALRQIQQASGVSIKLIDGGIQDVAHLTLNAGRVEYLDLRGATAAQALEWTIRPNRLTWRLQGNSVVVGSDRRLSGLSAWVYDVADIALPTQAELGKDEKKFTAESKRLTDQFLKVIRTEMKTEERDAIVWFAPGQLLVFGNTKQHASVGKLLDQLANPEAEKLREEAGQLQAITIERAKKRKEDNAKWKKVVHTSRVAQMHEAFGWQLLAAAAQGQFSDEAFTWLKIAWNDPATKEMLESDSRSLPLRTFWQIAEASKALPAETELAKLAATAREMSAPAVKSAIKLAQENPEEAQVVSALVYAALALRDDVSLQLQAMKYAARTDFKNENLGQASLLVRALLQSRKQIDSNALLRMINEGIVGKDMVVLAGLACRREGGQAWESFRARSSEVVGGQALPGHVVKLLHHLAENRLALTADDR